VLVIGHEAHGIPKPILDMCQEAMHLPMYGVNTSMNVAMAAGIAVYDQIRKLKKGGG
jgi:tRNA G18 (ribose-2'-O)-methylase SpoU